MKPLVTPPIISTTDADARMTNPEFTKLAFELVMDLPTWILPITGRVQALHPVSGSRYEIDDQLKPTNPPSEQILNLLRSGLDHLQALADAASTVGLRPLAPFTLIRSAVEACAMAMWLMRPGTIDARLGRSIRLTIQNRRDSETYTKKFGLGDQVSQWFIAEMTATKNQRPGTKNMDLKKNFPTLTSILQETDKLLKLDALAGLDVWRACSGMAHSNAHFAGTAQDRAENDDSIAVTVKMTTLMMMLQPAQQYFEFTLAQAERHMSATANKTAPTRR